MKIVSLVNQKGGVGKSLLCLNLAVVAEQSGEKVCIIDLDPQGTVRSWFDSRTADTPRVVAADKALHNGNLTKTLKALEAAGITLVFIDTKGEDSHATRIAMLASDFCLVPVQPSGPDLKASVVTVNAIKALPRPFLFVLNRAAANKNAKLTEFVSAALLAGGPVHATALVGRTDFAYSYLRGLGVTEHAPADKAADEVRELWAHVQKRLDNLEGTAHDEQKNRRRA
jgi:chromosome partitioning protein